MHSDKSDMVSKTMMMMTHFLTDKLWKRWDGFKKKRWLLTKTVITSSTKKHDDDENWWPEITFDDEHFFQTMMSVENCDDFFVFQKKDVMNSKQRWPNEHL